MESRSFRIRYFMKKKHKIMHRVLRALELPQDLDPHLIAIRWIGGEDLLIEQHRGILRYDSETVRFLCEQGIVAVSGSGLTLDRLTETRALIRGDIRSVCFEDKS